MIQVQVMLCTQKTETIYTSFTNLLYQVWILYDLSVFFRYLFFLFFSSFIMHSMGFSVCDRWSHVWIIKKWTFILKNLAHELRYSILQQCNRHSNQMLTKMTRFRPFGSFRSKNGIERSSQFSTPDPNVAGFLPDYFELLNSYQYYVQCTHFTQEFLLIPNKLILSKFPSISR